jgi:hypothetical protein
MQKAPLDTAGLEDSDDDGPPALKPPHTAEAPAVERSPQQDKGSLAPPDRHASIASKGSRPSTTGSPASGAVPENDKPDAADAPAQAVESAEALGEEAAGAVEEEEEEASEEEEEAEEGPKDKVSP